MKKILSLVLAVAMLSTVAFADAIPDVNPDGTGTTSVNPGKTLTLSTESFKSDGKVLFTQVKAAGAEFNATNFSITKKSFSKGATLVKSVGINDDDGVVEIKLNDNYELFTPSVTKAANLIIDGITVTAKKALKDEDGNVEVARSSKWNYEGDKKVWVGYGKVENAISGSAASYENDALVEFTGEAYGDASINVGDVTIEGRVYKGDKVFISIGTGVGDDQKAILKNNENADLRFYNVTTNGLPSNNDILLFVEEDQFIYEIIDGKIAKSNMAWNADDYAFKGKIRTNKKYVVSDIELKATAAEAGSENPDTGANDVVGVAAALAIVSLVAAGAVSLKK